MQLEALGEGNNLFFKLQFPVPSFGAVQIGLILPALETTYVTVCALPPNIWGYHIRFCHIFGRALSLLSFLYDLYTSGLVPDKWGTFIFLFIALILTVS